MKVTQPIEKYHAELCVIGGGMSGICAAVSAARRGVKVILIHDRPVLGGNASSEVRMWIRGASTAFPFYREGGIIEEIALRNSYYNPTMSYGQWDGVLYDLVVSESNIRLFLNASVYGAKEEKGSIKSVTAWQLTTYRHIEIGADYFADCSGDCILAELTPAAYTSGREAKTMFNESLAVAESDKKTMGNSCLIQAREVGYPVSYTPPSFARKLSDAEFNNRTDITNPDAFKRDNFWWMELGGEVDTVKDAENIKLELLALSYGVWDYIKNSGKFDSENWELDWVGFLGGKRENRRYIGDYVLNQNDIDNATVFLSEVAYGGWTMDDHHPAGFNTTEPPNHHHKISAPYAIPYECLYSKNIDNLFFAGRNISATHIALSSTRVMATCASLGQAVGTAAAIAKKRGITPRAVIAHIDELQIALLDDDCYLLNTKRKLSAAVTGANINASDADKKALLSGVERKLHEGDKGAVSLKKGSPLEFTFAPVYADKLRIVFDSDLPREHTKDERFRLYPHRLNIPKIEERADLPPALVKSYTVSVKKNGVWTDIAATRANFKRLVYVPIGDTVEGVRLTGHDTYGAESIRLFSIDLIG